MMIQHQLVFLPTDLQNSPSTNVAYRKSFLVVLSNANHGGNSHFRGHHGLDNGGSSHGNKPICQLCGKIGHVVVKCYKRFDISFSSVDLTSYQANIAFTSNFADHEWYVNSSATNHTTVDMNNLTINVDYMGNEKLMVGNGFKLAISQFGNSFLPYKNSSNLFSLITSYMFHT
ncbi:hypothetical protein VitviT2T_020344 [Vitis vinifera]|uniref:CCHC-type domain-containing protein n=1 Tax=Vitis vinifera TaxID=29760 RepID=A0ABY9D437_VITVI|nr:hypothetical protein VitviT2T_020344 [Vitis vinifera]